MLDQGLTRGDVRASDAASPAGWVREWGPSFRVGGAAALVRVAEAVAKPDNAPLAEAVLDARVPVSNAAVALTEMDKLLPRLTPACAETVLSGFVAIAETDGPAQIRALRPRVIAGMGGEVSSSAGRTCSSTAGRCPSRTPMTGWPSTGCGWTPKGRRCWRQSWGRWPHRSPRR